MFFLFVSGLSRTYRDQRESLGNRWFQRGVADLNAKRFEAAVKDFRAALLYSRDNYTYQLYLAEALLGMKRTGQAAAYLLNLWDRQPQDGLVNLELARIGAQKGQTQQAVRYYHDAVYAVWPSNSESQRRVARLELIDLLLLNNANAQAQAELIALAERVTDPSENQMLGDLFMRAGDYQHALTEYGLSLKTNSHNPKVLAGAGHAAYQLGQYRFAQHYLQEVLKRDPSDKQSAERLKTTELILHMDPFQRNISSAERNRRVMEAFETAGKRLGKCAVPSGDAGTRRISSANLSDQWSTMQPRVTKQGLQRNAGLPEQAMDLVFRIERETSPSCGEPTGTDLALLKIGKLHEGNSL
jgi:tetratricopeptide (TPR) repeat protein